jgi:toluene monooxygenase system ferredoxin subunit
MTWTSLGSLDDLWEGDIRGVQVDGQELIVLRLDGGELRAYQGICPHQEQRLDEGEFDEGKIICFGHLWEFDAATGKGINPNGCTLARYPVEVVDDDVRVSTAGVVPLYSF